MTPIKETVMPQEPPVRRAKVLQIFSRYLKYGGEEGSVHRIGQEMQKQFDVDGFVISSEDMLKGGKLKKALLPIRTYYNYDILKQLEATHLTGDYDFWQVHNVFPAISPGAYTLAARLDVPIIHYLHNYRFGCVNGFLFTQGQECRKCLQGNFIHGALGKCWRDSYAQSSMMALLLADTKRRGLFEQVRRWVAISQAQKELHVYMGIPEDRIDVVHHFYESPENILPPPFPEDGHALFVGRLSPEKGVAHLLRAWKYLPAHRKLIIMGDGPEYIPLQQMAMETGLSNVTFTGFVKHADQKKYWEGAAFSIVPSIWQEPFGMVVLESWAKGRPVVAHRIGALPEIIHDGEDGFLADPHDEKNLAEILEHSFSQGSHLARMGQKGLERLKTDYSSQRWLEEINGVYQRAQS